MLNKVILIGRLGQNAEAKTAQNNREYVVLSTSLHKRAGAMTRANTKPAPNGTASTPGRVCPSSPGR